MANIKDKKYFTFVENLQAGEEKFFNFQEIDKTQDYMPFHNMTIINEGLNDILIYINQVEQFLLIPSGTIKELTNEWITSLRVKNRSNTGEADFTLSVDNKDTELILLEKIAARL